MYEYEISEELDKKLLKISKKNRAQLEIIDKKMQ